MWTWGNSGRGMFQWTEHVVCLKLTSFWSISPPHFFVSVPDLCSSCSTHLRITKISHFELCLPLIRRHVGGRTCQSLIIYSWLQPAAGENHFGHLWDRRHGWADRGWLCQVHYSSACPLAVVITSCRVHQVSALFALFYCDGQCSEAFILPLCACVVWCKQSASSTCT